MWIHRSITLLFLCGVVRGFGPRANCDCKYLALPAYICLRDCRSTEPTTEAPNSDVTEIVKVADTVQPPEEEIVQTPPERGETIDEAELLDKCAQVVYGCKQLFFSRTMFASFVNRNHCLNKNRKLWTQCKKTFNDEIREKAKTCIVLIRKQFVTMCPYKIQRPRDEVKDAAYLACREKEVEPYHIARCDSFPGAARLTKHIEMKHLFEKIINIH